MSGNFYLSVYGYDAADSGNGQADDPAMLVAVTNYVQGIQTLETFSNYNYAAAGGMIETVTRRRPIQRWRFLGCNSTPFSTQIDLLERADDDHRFDPRGFNPNAGAEQRDDEATRSPAAGSTPRWTSRPAPTIPSATRPPAPINRKGTHTIRTARRALIRLAARWGIRFPAGKATRSAIPIPMAAPIGSARRVWSERMARPPNTPIRRWGR